LKKMLAFMGIGGERLRLEYIATSESGKLAQVFTSFTDHVRGLGPSPLKGESARG